MMSSSCVKRVPRHNYWPTDNKSFQELFFDYLSKCAVNNLRLVIGLCAVHTILFPELCLV